MRTLHLYGVLSTDSSFLSVILICTVQLLYFSPDSHHLLNLGSLPGSSWVTPSCAAAWRLMAVSSGVNGTHLVSHFSRIAVLFLPDAYCFETIVSHTLPDFFAHYNQESKFGPCYSVLGGNGSPLPLILYLPFPLCMFSCQF